MFDIVDCVSDINVEQAINKMDSLLPGSEDSTIKV